LGFLHRRHQRRDGTPCEWPVVRLTARAAPSCPAMVAALADAAAAGRDPHTRRSCATALCQPGEPERRGRCRVGCGRRGPAARGVHGCRR
jgi:hypothetical protein